MDGTLGGFERPETRQQNPTCRRKLTRDDGE
jgi:hypothetical protein